MQWIFNQGMSYFQFQGLSAVPGVLHGVFPRYAWDRSGQRLPMNYGLVRDQALETVWSHRRAMSAAVGVGVTVFADQVHGADVGVWERQTLQGSGDQQTFTLPDSDALVTDAVGHGLAIQVADCQSVLMVDRERRVVANVHSGWRGSVLNIIGRTVATMVARFGCRPHNIIAAIAPSLGPCCAQYVDYRTDFPSRYWAYRRSGDRFDFWQLSVDQLKACGVLGEHIEISGMCTRCNQQLFYSYRGDHASGRFATIIGLRF